jgi:hypothetical protein
MRDRRRDKRYSLNEPIAGVVRMFRDVIVRQHGSDEWIAISREAAVTGETLLLDLPDHEDSDGDPGRRLPVCVIESRPVIVDGEMRHRLLLHVSEPAPILFEQQIRR